MCIVYCVFVYQHSWKKKPSMSKYTRKNVRGGEGLSKVISTLAALNPQAAENL